jgi:hypothetical protein
MRFAPPKMELRLKDTTLPLDLENTHLLDVLDLLSDQNVGPLIGAFDSDLIEYMKDPYATGSSTEVARVLTHKTYARRAHRKCRGFVGTLVYRANQMTFRDFFAKLEGQPNIKHERDHVQFQPLDTKEPAKRDGFASLEFSFNQSENSELLNVLLSSKACSHSPSDGAGSEFMYDPLPDQNWIRLLILEPGTFKSPLICQVKAIRREQAARQYEALSYAWEEDVNYDWYEMDELGEFILDVNHITCNGSRVTIGANLVVALQHFRYRTSHRILWIDQLCIDQKNDRERSQQVQIMGSIYSNASRALVWLGDDDSHDGPGVFHMLCLLINKWNPAEKAHFRSVNRDTSEETIISSTGKHTPDQNKLESAIFAPFHRKYFQRRWVIQEITLSRTVDVVWGHATIPWRWMGLAAALLRTQHDSMVRAELAFGVYNAYLIFELSQTDMLASDQPSFLQLLRLTSRFENTDPRDRVYALLGIPTKDNYPMGETFLPIDYTIDEKTLNRLVTDKLMAQNRPISFLCNAAFDPHKPLEPSWVPGWGKQSLAMLSPWALDDCFNPSGDLAFTKIPSADPSHLVLEGIHISTVLWSGLDLALKFAMEWEDVFRILHSGAFDPLSQSSLELFARTLCASRDTYGARETEKSAHVRHFAALIQQSQPNDVENTNPVIVDVAIGGEPDQFLQIVDTICEGRTFFATTSGHIGLGPSLMRPGDAIYVIAGAEMPFILRKDAESFRLVGECYGDECMNGEAVQAMREGRNLPGSFAVSKLKENLCTFNDLPETAAEAQVALKSMKEDLVSLATRASTAALQLTRLDVV